MKLFVILALVAAAAAAPAPQNDVQLLRYSSDNDGLGGYKYDFEQSDGNKHNEEGQLLNAGSDNEYLSVKGSYSYVGPDGVTYVVNYIADDKGFQPMIFQTAGGSVPSAVIASLLG